jgi:Holliday junction DNA helicase RuvA
MIGRIAGELVEKTPPTILIDVAGVGYEVEVPLTTMTRLPSTGAQIVIYTHFVVREDAQLLYGFFDQQERQVFRSLIRVNGVGPKLALAILSGMDIGEFVTCIKSNDVQALVRLPGVGKKTAERLIIEMKDRLDEWGVGDVSEGGSATLSATASARATLRDAETALIALGYKPQEAMRAITALKDTNLDVEGLIKEALKRMG